MVDFKFVLSLLTVCLTHTFSAADDVCDNDSDCLPGYYCCKGTVWCCPYGSKCTGTETCEVNSFFRHEQSTGYEENKSSRSTIRVGKIVGSFFGVLIGICGVCGCCYIKNKSNGNTSDSRPPVESQAQPPAEPPSEPLAQLSVQPLAKFSAQPPDEPPPAYTRL